MQCSQNEVLSLFSFTEISHKRFMIGTEINIQINGLIER